MDMASHFPDAFGEYVGLDVHLRTDGSTSKSRAFHGVRDEHDREGIGEGVHDGQAHAVDGDRSFGNDFTHQYSDGKTDDLPFAGSIAGRDFADAVHVPLNEVPAEPLIEPQSAFKVDDVSRLALAERSSLQRFRSGLELRRAIVDGDDSEATAV